MKKMKKQTTFPWREEENAAVSPHNEYSDVFKKKD